MTSHAQPFLIRRNAAGQLQLIDAQGQQHDGVYPARAFPVSAPDAGISILSQDGHELVWIEDLSILVASSRQYLLEALAIRELMPKIVRIHRVSSFATPSLWEVETHIGHATLTLTSEDKIWRVQRNKLIISDKHGLNFVIEQLDQLDRHSKKLLDRFL